MSNDKYLAAEIARLRKALEQLRQEHYHNDADPWYSCPASGKCENEMDGNECNCGADASNAIIDAALGNK